MCYKLFCVICIWIQLAAVLVNYSVTVASDSDVILRYDDIWNRQSADYDVQDEDLQIHLSRVKRRARRGKSKRESKNSDTEEDVEHLDDLFHGFGTDRRHHRRGSRRHHNDHHQRRHNHHHHQAESGKRSSQNRQAQKGRQTVRPTPGGAAGRSNAKSSGDMRKFGQTSLSSRRSKNKNRNRGKSRRTNSKNRRRRPPSSGRSSKHHRGQNDDRRTDIFSYQFLPTPSARPKTKKKKVPTATLR